MYTGSPKGQALPAPFSRGVGRLRLRVTAVLDKWQEPERQKRAGTEPGLQPCRFFSFETHVKAGNLCRADYRIGLLSRSDSSRCRARRHREPEYIVANEKSPLGYVRNVAARFLRLFLLDREPGRTENQPAGDAGNIYILKNKPLSSEI